MDIHQHHGHISQAERYEHVNGDVTQIMCKIEVSVILKHRIKVVEHQHQAIQVG